MTIKTNNITINDVTIADGATESGIINLKNRSLVGITLDSALDGTSLTFLVSPTEGGAYQEMIDGLGSAVSKTVASSKYLKLDPLDTLGIQYLKIKSGTAQSGAATTLSLHTTEVN